MTVKFDTEKAVSGVYREKTMKCEKSETKKARKSKLSPSTVKSLGFLLLIYVVSLSVIYSSELIRNADSKSYGLAEIISSGGEMSIISVDDQITADEEAKKLTEEYVSALEIAAAEYVASIESTITKEVAKTIETPVFLSNGYAFPANGSIESGFESRLNPFYISNTTESEIEFHKGLDITVPVGSSVFAFDDGIVSEISVSKTLGNYVVISHGDYETLYAHLNQAICRKGDAVNAGDAIGFSGATGRTLSPHLHFEIRVNGEAIDPMDYMS